MPHVVSDSLADEQAVAEFSDDLPWSIRDEVEVPYGGVLEFTAQAPITATVPAVSAIDGTAYSAPAVIAEKGSVDVTTDGKIRYTAPSDDEEALIDDTICISTADGNISYIRVLAYAASVDPASRGGTEYSGVLSVMGDPLALTITYSSKGHHPKHGAKRPRKSGPATSPPPASTIDPDYFGTGHSIIITPPDGKQVSVGLPNQPSEVEKPVDLPGTTVVVVSATTTESGEIELTLSDGSHVTVKASQGHTASEYMGKTIIRQQQCEVAFEWDKWVYHNPPGKWVWEGRYRRVVRATRNVYYTEPPTYGDWGLDPSDHRQPVRIL